MTEQRSFVLNAWSAAATVLVVAAAVTFIAVMSGPYSSGDSKTFYSLGPTLLAGSTFFTAFVVMERGWWPLGFAALLAAPFGWLLVIYAIWQEGTSTSNTADELWTGILALVVALMAVTSSLLAQTTVAKALAIGATAVALLATALSLDAAWGNEQFWRVGTPITSLWILAATLYFLVPILERAQRRSPQWLVAAAALVGAGTAGVVAVVSGDFSPQGYSIVFTLMAAVLTISALLGGVVAMERGARVFAWTAIAVSPLAFAMLVEGIWHDSDDRFRLIATGVVLALALLVALSARLFARSGPLVALAGAAGILGATTAAISIDAIWRDDRYFLVAQTTTALWILAILCCLLVPLLERHRAETEPAPG